MASKRPGRHYRRYLISGRVQGVFFRASCAREAQRLGICGSAINLPDGRVEVQAAGPPDALSHLADWLHDGPPHARVDAVEAADIDPFEAAGFRTG